MIARAHDPVLVLGTAGVGAERHRVTVSPESYATHAVIAGASGSGKTQIALAMACQLQAACPSAPMIGIDPKGDLLGISRFLAALIPTLPEKDAETILSNFKFISPFRDPTFEMNMLAPNGDEPEVQALGVLDAIEAALDSDLGGFERLAALLLSCLTAGIEGICNLLDVPRMLTDTVFRRNLLSRLPPGRSKETLESRIKLAPAATMGAIVARLDRLFSTKISRRVLSTPGCFSWTGSLDHGVSVFDVTDPPGGQPALQKLIGGYALQTLATKLLARPVSSSTEALTLIIDELPELLTRKTATELGRLLALVRYRKVGVHLLYQDESQLEKRAPELLALLRANARRLLMFRGHPASLKWIEPFLPPPALKGVGPTRDDRSTPFHAEHARRMLASMASLPTMIALHVDRATGKPGEFIATPRLDLLDIERRALQAPERVRRILGLIPLAVVSLPEIASEPDIAAPALTESPSPGCDSVEVPDSPARSAETTGVVLQEESRATPVSAAVTQPVVTERRLYRFVLGWMPGAPLPGVVS